MNDYYIGLDIHKKSIRFCIKRGDGTIVSEGTIASTREALRAWRRGLPAGSKIAMEATMFTGWIYDELLAHVAAVLSAIRC